MTSHPKTLPEQGSNDDDGGAIARVDADLMITQVTSDDVLLGRGAGMYNHVGNVHFRDAVETRKDEYHSTTNERKREIARQVLSEVLRRGGRFLQLTSDGAHYETVDETRALNKCFHDLRGKKKGESDVSAQHDQTRLTGSSKRSFQEDEEKKLEALEYPLSSFYAISEGVQEDIRTDAVDSSVPLNPSQAKLNRPRMSLEEIAMERKQLTQEERLEAMTDMFGKYCIKDDKRIKQSMDDAYVKSALQMMRREIEWIPMDEKGAFMEAMSLSDPEEFSDNKMQAFLRCVDWHPKRAAERFVKYWEKRRQLFGPEKYHLPMTLSGALRDDITALEAAVICPLPHGDASGRQLLWYQLARNTFEGYTPDSLLRVAWYITETLSQQDTENKGIVRLGYHRGVTMRNIDSDLLCENMVLTRDCWPVKVVAEHNMCVPEEVIRLFVPLTQAAKGRDLRSRSVFHEGPDSDVLGKLASHGIFSNMLPSDIGGTVEISIGEWMANRRKAESEETGGDMSFVQGNDSVALDEDLEALLDQLKENEDLYRC